VEPIFLLFFSIFSPKYQVMTTLGSLNSSLLIRVTLFLPDLLKYLVSPGILQQIFENVAVGITSYQL